MPVYIALLRGINVGAHKRMKMEKLRACCEGLGWENAKTFIQSGNVAFRASKLSPAALAEKLEQKILKDFGFSADVVTRSQNEMAKIIETNPIIKQRGIDVTKLHVVFLPRTPEAE